MAYGRKPPVWVNPVFWSSTIKKYSIRSPALHDLFSIIEHNSVYVDPDKTPPDSQFLHKTKKAYYLFGLAIRLFLFYGIMELLSSNYIPAFPLLLTQ
jgi:hypothetical protein